MSKLLAEFISNLAAKAGLKADDAELLELVQNKALAIDIPDTLVNALEQNIHSLQSAESKIKNKLRFQTKFQNLQQRVIQVVRIHRNTLKKLIN